jgi:hypothetical protein
MSEFLKEDEVEGEPNGAWVAQTFNRYNEQLSYPLVSALLTLASVLADFDHLMSSARSSMVKKMVDIEDNNG